MHSIGIDARLISQTGVGVYLRNLLYFLEKIFDNDITFYIYLMHDDYNKVQFKRKNFIRRAVGQRWHTLGEQVGFAKTLYQDKLDLMHFTYFSYPILYRKKFLTTIHDVTPLLFRTGKASTKNPLLYKIKFVAYKFVISQQINNSSAIITPTKTVKKQLINIFGKSVAQKITPIYEGVDYELIELASSHSGHPDVTSVDARIRFWTSQNDVRHFFIYVGNFYPHKNVERLIQAFAIVKSDVKLILIGPDDFFAKRLLQLIIKLKQEQRIIFYHDPTKEDLVYFYKNALALIHPSLSEGFGLPLVEAANFKLPIIASNIEVFKEILDEKYISFDPKKPEDIAAKIRQFLQEKNKFDNSKIIDRFFFEKMAKKTKKLYEILLSSKR